MSAQMNILGATSSLMSLDIGGFFRNLFDDPEGYTKKILEKYNKGEISEAEATEEISNEAQKHPNNAKMQQILVAMQQGGGPGEVIDAAEAAFDPAKATEKAESRALMQATKSIEF